MSVIALPSIGLIGYGTIGRRLAAGAAERGFARVAYVVCRSAVAASELPAGAASLTELDEALDHDVDLVVEVAAPAVVREIAGRALRRSSLMLFSATALADDELRAELETTCREHATNLYLPHGAGLALDGLADGRQLIRDVTVTTVKHPRSFGAGEDRAGVLFEGTTREACMEFPRSVNVHAMVALAGVGFDVTRSRIIADPTATSMRHEIRVRGEGLVWDLTIASQGLGGVTGSYAPASAIGSVQRVLAAKGRMVVA